MKRITLLLALLSLLTVAADPPQPPTPKPPKKPIIMRGAAVPKLASLDDTNAPDYVVLSTLTVSDGSNTFTAKLGGFQYPHVAADSKSCVVIFPLRWTNYVFEASTNMGGFTNWQTILSGTRPDTNTAIILIDLHGGAAPSRFFRQREGSVKD